MKKPTRTYNAFDIVVVPFPFNDPSKAKHRPAIILSSPRDLNQPAGASILGMITSAKHSQWPCDVEISDLKECGLPVKSIIQMKLFTLDHRLFIKKIGVLSKMDQKQLILSFKLMFPFI